MSDTLRVRINGRAYTLDAERPRSLLSLLRDEAGLTGTKEGCGNGECGACAVLLDGVAVRSCLILAQEVEGCEVVTIEGLAASGRLHPIQQAFIDTGAVQCGYCAPGFIMAIHGLLERMPNPSRDEIRQAVSGHLCRCTGYEAINQAVQLAVERRAADDATAHGSTDHGP